MKTIMWGAMVLAFAMSFGTAYGSEDGLVGSRKRVMRTVTKHNVADKLRTCDFLVNSSYKKNAKFYLCLFSASWCGPCRAEMPRIAKTYAETLKDDPDIELIHFSRDRNDEKATAWANEHNVKFPVIGPNGGNPLDLHTSGIPHLFILKADGTLVEEGHPMRIFNEAKFRELKGEADPDQAKAAEREDANSGRTKAKDKVAKALQECDFMLNKSYKKNAKYYLCLLSASWCPPCRREMPRIAKLYAEEIRGDRDLELIHFSCDRDEESARVWANEHNVKFPVVAPDGGNPLDLDCHGIPHVFILKADGTLVEEGHPVRLLTEEKLRELK